MLNINLYEGILRISKAKLYKSPYRKSIDQVWEIINKLKPKNKINFLKNLINLEIAVVDKQEIEKKFYNAMALYENNNNKIYLTNSYELLDSNLNHELFHMSSSKSKKKMPGITFDNTFYNYGKYLDEGITEYLNLKSRDEKISNSGYQTELFVIEVLIFIFGEQILEPYFNNDGIAFLEQFKKLNISFELIVKLDENLKKMTYNYEINNYRSSCLIFSDIYSNVVDENIDFFRKIKLNLKDYRILYSFLAKYQSKLKSKMESTIISFDYQFKNIEKKKVFDEYKEEFQKYQRENFAQILDLLIEIARIKEISFNDFYNFIQTALFYKNDEFKELYTDIIDENIKLPNKKR